MKWKLWLDDQARTPGLDSFRYPPNDDPDWIIACSSAEAIELTKKYGLPYFIDYDCDLGDGDSSMKYVNYISTFYYDHPVPNYIMHSRNPEEAKNVISKMESWKKSQSL